MRTIVFRLGTRSRRELQDFLHSRLNFEFNDITWLDAGEGSGDRVPVRFFNKVLALRALLLWGLYRWQTRPSSRPGALTDVLRVTPDGSPHAPRPLMMSRPQRRATSQPAPVDRPALDTDA